MKNNKCETCKNCERLGRFMTWCNRHDKGVILDNTCYLYKVKRKLVGE